MILLDKWEDKTEGHTRIKTRRTFLSRWVVGWIGRTRTCRAFASATERRVCAPSASELPVEKKTKENEPSA